MTARRTSWPFLATAAANQDELTGEQAAVLESLERQVVHFGLASLTRAERRQLDALRQLQHQAAYAWHQAAMARRREARSAAA